MHRSLWPALLLGVLCTEPSFRSTPLHVLFAVVGCVLVTAGTVGRVWCGLYLFGRKTKELCRDGPYSLCRNPMYVCSFLSIMGLALASDRVVLMIALPVLLGATYLGVIKAEERRLLAAFGPKYREYCGVTPRIVPCFDHYRARTTITLAPRDYMRGIVKGMGYVWLLLLVQLVEALRMC